MSRRSTLVCLSLLALAGCGTGSSEEGELFRVHAVTAPHRSTRAAWGPDGRLYVATLSGNLAAFAFDDAYEIRSVEHFSGLSGSEAPAILGLAFSPFDVGEPARLYVAHAALETRSGDCSESFVPFSGGISLLQGPDFDTPLPVVTGLPASGRAHGVNGLDFGPDGDLYVCVGGATNAGVPSCAIGGMPASPWSAAILRLAVGDPLFDGALRYTQRGTGTPILNQLEAAEADAVPAHGVTLWATGLRNAFDLVWTSDGSLFATDNGANAGDGDASLSPTESMPVPAAQDELLRIESDSYYGHPNRNRGRDVARENTFAANASGSGDFTPAMALFPPSTNGLDEYRSAALGAKYRGVLLAQQFSGATFAIRVDGAVAEVERLPIDLPALDVLAGPGGALIGVDFIRDRLRIAVPREPWGGVVAGTPTRALYDVFPSRGPEAGGGRFVLAGRGLGGAGEVRFGSQVATTTARRPTRIEGHFPAGVGGGMVDVGVTFSDGVVVLPNAFSYLSAP